MTSRGQSPRTLYLLTQTSQGLRARVERALRPLEVTGLQYTVLSIIAVRGGLSSSDLSRWFFVTPQTMNEIVTGLDRRGLLERTAAKGNRRSLLMNLSPSGRQLLAACDAKADEIESTAFGRMTEKQLRQLRRALTGLLVQLSSGDAPEPTSRSHTSTTGGAEASNGVNRSISSVGPKGAANTSRRKVG